MFEMGLCCIHKILAIRYFGIILAWLLGSGAIFAAETQQAYREIEGGKVEYRGTLYRDFSTYLRSSQFQTDGRRCGIDAHLQNRRADFSLSSPRLARSVSDCTEALTNIKSEYWPGLIAYEIPVWFHIISKSNGEGEISNERIQGQIAVLNEDFRALTETEGALGFDVKIQFRLAGITRVQSDAWFTDSDADEDSYKSTLAKDPTKYLNIYTNDARGYLGYATLPQNAAGNTLDGIVLRHSVVSGRDGLTSASPYNRGRTAVHEVGHYLGLVHTFQGIGGYCENGYSTGDLIADTNSESLAFYGCGTRDTCGTADPTNNYMNYTDDACMNRFSREQANRMVCSLVNYRSNLAKIVELDVDASFLPPILHLLLLDDE